MQNQKIQAVQQKQTATVSQSHEFKMKWLGIGHGVYKEQSYQYVYRPFIKQSTSNTVKKGTDGIQVIPIIEYPDHKEIVFIANFRPPVGKFVIEFPAGIAEGQDMIENVRRQLEQQVGMVPYKLVEMPSPAIYADPHKGNESGIYFIALIDGSKPQSFVPFKRQVTENIRCYSMRYDQEKGICEELDRFARENDYIFDGKSWVVCMAVDMVERLKREDIFILGK